MAQKILLRRGSVTNIPSTATSQGELLLATGSIGTLAGPFITMTGTAGPGTSTIVGKIYQGSTAPDISLYSQLTGTTFYATSENALYRLNHAGNQKLNLSGNISGNTLENITASGSFSGSFEGDGSGLTGIPASGLIAPGSNGQFIYNNGGSFDGFSGLTVSGTDVAVSNDLQVTGDITGSNLQLSGNANIDGNIILGGNITIGDENTDDISIGGEFTSNLIPDADDTYAIGSPSRRWNLYGVGSSISGSFNGDFTGTLADGTSLIDIRGTGAGSGTDAITVGDTLTFTNASTHGFAFNITNNQVSLATPQDLRTTALPSFNSLFLTSLSAGVDNTVLILNGDNELITDEIDGRVWGSTLLDGAGSLTANRVPFVSDANTLTDDAGLTYNAGTDTLTVGTSTFGTNVTIAGDLTVSGTTTTIDSTVVNIGDNIITLNAAGAVADGGIQVIDTTGTAHTGSLLWNATNDYWYAGISGSTHHRVATYTNATPATNTIPRIDSNKRLVASSITDTGTQVVIVSDLYMESSDIYMNDNDILGVNSITISGLAADSFVITDGSSALDVVTPSTAGDLIQWNGAAFVASNTVDGGTF